MKIDWKAPPFDFDSIFKTGEEDTHFKESTGDDLELFFKYLQIGRRLTELF